MSYSGFGAQLGVHRKLRATSVDKATLNHHDAKAHEEKECAASLSFRFQSID